MLAGGGGWTALLLCVVFGMVVLLPLLRQRDLRECILRGALLLAVGILGVFCQVRQEQTWNEEKQRLPLDTPVCIQGTLVAKEQKQNSWQLTIALPDMKNRLLVSAQDGAYPLDCVLLIEGSVREFDPPRNEGQFNQKQYYKCRQIMARVYAEKITCCRQPSGVRAWREALFVLRTRMRQVYEQCLPPQQAGILSAMAVGEKRLLDEDVRGLFQDAGISHILAISGLHISLIGAGCYGCLRRFRCSYVLSALCGGMFLLLYGTLIGSSVSSGRAIGMFCIYLLAQCLGHSYDSGSALAAMAFGYLLTNPSVLCDVSFQLSFLAVAAAVSIRELLPQGRQGHRIDQLVQSACASLLIQLVTLPVLAWYFYELPLYALLFNVLLLPFVGALLGFGLAGGCVGVLALPLGRLVLLPARLLLSLQLSVCTWVKRLPLAVCVCGRPTTRELWVYVLFLATGLLILEWRQTRHRRALAKEKIRRKKESLMRRALYRSSGCLLLFAVILHGILFLAPQMRQTFEISYLDVGQGDGAFVRTEGGTTLFVDGGSSDVSAVGTYRLLPFLKSKGIRRVDYWVLSHLDEDHVSGFYEVAESGYPIGCVVVSARMPQSEAKNRLYALLREHRIPLMEADAAQELTLDEKGAYLRFLSPSENTPFDDANGASLVCCYESPLLRALFTGDISAQQEQWLLEQGVLSSVDLYKAAHHGSKYSNSQEFLEALLPRLSVISCAQKNSYGHPGEEAIAHMQAAGSRICYTMYGGQITVRSRHGQLSVEEYVTDRAAD